MSVRAWHRLTLALATLLPLSMSFAQQPARHFEITAVRENRSGSERDSGVNINGTKISATNLSLRIMMQQAYGVLDFQIIGGPNWLSTARFDLQADTGDGQPISNAEFGPMLQQLLADRFHLTVHHETRPMKEYALTIANGGPRLQVTTGQPQNSMQGINQNATQGTAKMIGSGIPISALAYRIAQQRPFRGNLVIDKTGLTGFYDITLEWEAGDNAASSLITSLQQQLGLKLIYQKMPVDVLVIDHAEKPSEN